MPAQLDDVSARVKTGESLSAAFEAQSGFPVMYTTTLLAGERSGNLQEVLERYVSFQRVSLTFRKKLISVADLSLRAADAGDGADDFHVHGGGAAVCHALRPDGIESCRR